MGNIVHTRKMYLHTVETRMRTRWKYKKHQNFAKTNPEIDQCYLHIVRQYTMYYRQLTKYKKRSGPILAVPFLLRYRIVRCD